MTHRAKLIKQLLDKYPEGRKTKNQYKIMTLAIKQMFPCLEHISNKQMRDIVYELAHMPRDWRKETQEEETSLKYQLSQEWQINNGYKPEPQNKLFKNKLYSYDN